MDHNEFESGYSHPKKMDGAPNFMTNHAAPYARIKKTL
jgi:hypothetical protein